MTDVMLAHKYMEDFSVTQYGQVHFQYKGTPISDLIQEIIFSPCFLYLNANSAGLDQKSMYCSI